MYPVIISIVAISPRRSIIIFSFKNLLVSISAFVSNGSSHDMLEIIGISCGTT
jgi:hypothetical protein